MAKIYQFPEPVIRYGYKIPLYTDEEISFTIICVNAFSQLQYKITETDLSNIDPTLVVDAITKAKQSNLLSNLSFKLANKILNNVEKISL